MLGSNQVDTKWNQIGRYRAAKAGRVEGVEGVECLGCVGELDGWKDILPVRKSQVFLVTSPKIAR